VGGLGPPLHVAAKLAPNNAALFVNAVIRWKSMYNEFICLLVTEGMGGTFTKAYQQILELHKSGKALDQQKILEVASAHKQEENKLVEAHGKTVLNILFQHNYESIQELLEEDEAVIDYCYVGASTTKDLVVSEVHCAVVLIKPKGEPSAYITDTTKLGHWGTQWLDFLGKSISNIAPSSEANSVSRKLCFPLKSRKLLKTLMCIAFSYVMTSRYPDCLWIYYFFQTTTCCAKSVESAFSPPVRKYCAAPVLQF